MDQQTGLIVINAALAIFTLGLAFSAGKHINRIDHIEDWRREFIVDLKEWRANDAKQINQMFKEIRSIHELITTNDDTISKDN